MTPSAQMTLQVFLPQQPHFFLFFFKAYLIYGCALTRVGEHRPQSYINEQILNLMGTRVGMRVM